MFRAFWLVILLIASTYAWSADEKGQFAIRNAGMASCQNFLDEKNKQSSKFNLYIGWIDGYLSAANQFTPSTFDLIPWGNTLFLATLLENHCKNSPDERFYLAINKLAAAMMPQRIKKQSKLIETSHKGKKSFIYQETLARIQEHLKEKKLYGGSVDGSWGPQTRKAIEKFQKQNNIAVTGLPDQITMYLVFQALAKIK